MVEIESHTLVVPALVAGIHAFLAAFQRSKAWMAGTCPAMTRKLESTVGATGGIDDDS
jgi:hypothetical protein